MSTTVLDATDAAGSAIEEAVAVFMLHPETFAESVAAGYQNPLAGYVAGRGGVLGDTTGATVAAQVYWEQAAAFGRKYLAGAEGLDRLAALGEKVVAVTPTVALPLFAGWRTMPLAGDAPARALQVMFVLRELRGGVHFNLLALSGVTPVEAHMLNKGPQYTAVFGWPEPYADGADKLDRYDEIRQETNRRMSELLSAALDPAEIDELARVSAAALATLKANVPG